MKEERKMIMKKSFFIKFFVGQGYKVVDKLEVIGSVDFLRI